MVTTDVSKIQTRNPPMAWQVARQGPTGPAYTEIFRGMGTPTGESEPGTTEPIPQLAIVPLKELQDLIAEVRQLRAELAKRPLVSSTLLSDLGDDRLSVRVPIPVVLEEIDDESLARWPEVGASGIGSTLAEAITQLKMDVLGLFFDLTTRDTESLGQFALDTLRSLKVHVQELS